MARTTRTRHGRHPSRMGGRTERGQSTVEFALVLIPLLLVAVGALDFGRAVLASHLVAAGAREGARVGVSPAATSAQICERAARAVTLPDVPRTSGCGAAGPLTVQVLRRGTAGDPNDPVQVSLSYRFSPVTPLVSQFLGGPIILDGASSMVVER